jgi:hypothetical protein
MSHALLSCLLLSVLPAQEPPLEIGNPRLTYGYLGAPRPKGAGILPGDTAHITFEIKNLKLDEQSKASYSVAIEIRDDKGKLFFEQRPYNSVARNYLGGPSLPCAAHVHIPLDAKPGGMAWKITVTDRSTKQSAVLTGAGKILPADFGIVQVGLFADAEARVPTSAIGVVGDSFYLQCAAAGFSRSQKSREPNLNVTMRILDEAGKLVPARPVTVGINTGIPERESVVPIQFGLTLNRAGRFTIELDAQDLLTGRTARIQYALRVLPLE